MKHLGTLVGEGELFCGRKSFGRVGYRIDVTESSDVRTGIAKIAIDPQKVALEAQGFTLRLKDGGSVSLVYIRDDGQGTLFGTNGPIPGF